MTINTNGLYMDDNKDVKKKTPKKRKVKKRKKTLNESGESYTTIKNLSQKDFLALRADYLSGQMTVPDVAKKYNIKTNTLKVYACNHKWKHRGVEFEIIEAQNKRLKESYEKKLSENIDEITERNLNLVRKIINVTEMLVEDTKDRISQIREINAVIRAESKKKKNLKRNPKEFLLISTSKELYALKAAADIWQSAVMNGERELLGFTNDTKGDAGSLDKLTKVLKESAENNKISISNLQINNGIEYSPMAVEDFTVPIKLIDK